MKKHDSTRLFDLSCQGQLEIPPAWANSYVTVDAALSTSNDRGRQYDALNGVALSVRNSQLDKPASVHVAELLTVMASGASRRNVSGAIAWKRSIATSRSDDNRAESKQAITAAAHDDSKNSRQPPQALPLRNDLDGNRSRLTDSFRNGHIDRSVGPPLLRRLTRRAFRL